MTVIAYRNGIIACDSISSTRFQMNGHFTKIARNYRGDLAGASGDATYAHDFLEWFKSNEKGPTPDAIDREDKSRTGVGVIIRSTDLRDVLVPVEVYQWDRKFIMDCEYYACGSGAELAVGAFFAGADVTMAVQAAIKHEPYCGGAVQMLSHGGGVLQMASG